MYKSLFKISKMDCPSEEQMIRMKLDDIPGIHGITANIPERELTVHHEGPYQNILEHLVELDLGTTFIDTQETSEFQSALKDSKEKKILWSVLLINLGFFIIELTTGFISRSMGLVADSLDMLADAVVYGLSLYAVGAAVTRKKNIARISGYFQMLLAVLGLAEVVRRFLGYDVPPDFLTMIIVSLLALGGNAVSLYLLQKAKSEDAHMKASMIFTSNDIIVNLGVIAAAVLVSLTTSNKPDLIIGSIVFLVVMRGAYRILKLSR